MKLRLIFLAALGLQITNAQAEDRQTAVFAGGCFWCVEADFDKLDGVLATTSGFAGGTVPNPTYEQVVREDTGHREVVEIAYDAEIVSFEALAEYLLRTVDPTDAGGQFCDRGFSYTTAIYAQDAAQLETAQAVVAELQGELDAPIVTEIVDGGQFYPAEDYHQNYYEERPLRYRFYRSRCGRDERVEEVWGSQIAG
ncbi:peptide-methionine (S)-S-oxide reductase MsrA [Roseobacter sp. HKCCA0434]|uniref:peptide-methionine (S)-S-oxide reductase MsrA n=1 Tax=Roseobacter sp. HKCCA0434 TaxID=3079297 RepID=UPI002905DD41|nr:peptide-methionine (S)-S-oxide reductase MsrA [Roseobacter sp. HKCCA0434]